MVLFSNLKLNARVQVKWRGEILNGTVRYTGRLVTRSGDWVGVELDERGKKITLGSKNCFKNPYKPSGLWARACFIIFSAKLVGHIIRKQGLEDLAISGKTEVKKTRGGQWKTLLDNFPKTSARTVWDKARKRLVVWVRLGPSEGTHTGDESLWHLLDGTLTHRRLDLVRLESWISFQNCCKTLKQS